MAPRDTTSYNNQSKQTLAGAKLLVVGEINVVAYDEKSTICVTATPQEVMYSPVGNFGNQGGASWDAIITPFQINGSSAKLPTMPTTASPACVVSQSNHVDPPINEWTPPVIDISYLNPFKRPSDPSHGQGDHYDGTILFNGDKDDNQNLINSDTFPTDLRPMALRGPLVIQGWGYDLNGKPIPNKEDDEDDAREGTFVDDELKDEFLDDWIQKRETWPVAPVDLRYDRDRKVWTIPNTFRIIQVEVTGEEGIPAGETNPDCTPLNINTVYKGDGTEVSAPKVSVTNPSWGLSITSGQSFYAFYDTKDCTYYPIASSGTSGCDPKVTGTGAGNSIAVTVSEISGCKIYNVSGCDPVVTGSGDITVTVSGTGSGECTTYTVSGCDPKVTGTGDGNNITVTVSETGGCKIYNISGSGCDPVVTGTGEGNGITVTVSESDGCKTYNISGCDPTFTGLGSITVENTGECNYTISGCETELYGDGTVTVTRTGECGYWISGAAGAAQCLPTVSGKGDITVTVSGGACKTYWVSGCDPKVTGAGDITVTLATSNGCDIYTVSGSGACPPTFTGLGGITVENTGECNYTISGCEVTVTGGSGILVERDGCEYTVNYDGCHTAVSGEGCIIVTDNGATGPEYCHEYLIELEPTCLDDFTDPHWSLCGSAVNSGNDVTFTASTSGCGTVTCASESWGKNVEIHSPKASLTGLGNITVVDSGNCGYTISGCETELHGHGTVTVTPSGECGYSISGCDSTFLQAGTVTVTSTEVGGCKTYTISGIPAGGGGGEAQYNDADYCDWEGNLACVEIPCLTFGEGLQLDGTVVSAPLLNINSIWVDDCAPVPEPTDIAAGLTFGNNLMATKNLCNWTVEGLDQKISSTAGLCPDVDAIVAAVTFKELHFENNISVSVGGCVATIKGLDQKVNATLQDCIPGSETFIGQDFSKLIFSDNIGITQNNCEMTIKGLDQKIQATLQDCIPDSENITEVMDKDFSKLIFSNNIGVELVGCDATIKGLNQKIFGNSGVCNQSDIGLKDFQKLTFGKNLGVQQDGAKECDFIIEGLDQKIAATGGICGLSNIVTPVDFQKLTFGENLGVRQDGSEECDFIIEGLDQKIRSTSPQCSLSTGLFANFTGIDFSENIGVTVSNCLATVKGLDQQIEGTWSQPDSPCIPHEAVPVGDFKKLIFADNIAIESGEGCTYTISGLDQKISAAVGQCPPLDAVEPRIFTELNFAENISVDMEGTSCKAVIKGLSQQIMASGLICMGGVNYDKPASGSSNIQTWDFQENIAVIQKPDCTWAIKGLSQLIEGKESICGLSNVEEDTFRKLTFGKNLGVTMDDPTAGLCQYTISGQDQRIQGLGGAAVNCGTTVAEDDFTRLQFADGIKITKDDCSYKIQKVLKTSNSGVVHGRAGGQVAGSDDYVCELEAGCGIKATDDGGKTVFSLDNTSQAANFLNDVEIQLVSDICCLGSGFDIKYRTITFSECGLFKGVTDEDACPTSEEL